MSTNFDLMPERNGRLDLPDPDSLSVDSSSAHGLTGATQTARATYEPPAAVVPQSGLALIAADFADEDIDTDTVIPVTTRPGYALRVSTNITGDELDAWRKLAKNKRKVDGVDNMKLVALVLANKTTAILRQGEPLTDGEGDLLNFRHRSLMRLVDRTTAADAVRAFFGRDGAVDAAAKAVLDEAGWGDEVAPDPTEAG